MMTKKHVAQQESGYGAERRKGCMPTLFRSYWLRIQGHLSPEKACTITTCALVLHNFLRKSLSKNDYTPPGFLDSVNSQGELVRGSWRSEKGNSLGVFSSSIVSQVEGKAPKNAEVIREIFTEYFVKWGKCWMAVGQGINWQRNEFLDYFYLVLFLNCISSAFKQKHKIRNTKYNALKLLQHRGICSRLWLLLWNPIFIGWGRLNWNIMYWVNELRMNKMLIKMHPSARCLKFLESQLK